MKKLVFAVLLTTSFVMLAVWQRHFLLFELPGSSAPPPLLDVVEESGSSYWYDDYFLVDQIDSQTFAIGEPRYYQQNFSYLILGTESAILFDAGPGLRDIRPVTNSLTDLPITFIPSHFHYDHIGNTITFENVAVIDLPYLRRRAESNSLKLTWAEHLGSSEGIAAPTLEIDEWLPINSSLDLGERVLQVLYTPGHTEDSVSLLDTKSGMIFSGDFIYPGALYAFLPTSNMGDYLVGAETLLENAKFDAELYGAHRSSAPGLPLLATEDVLDLRAALIAIKNRELEGSGMFPRMYKVNERLDILAEPSWLQNWVPDSKD